jgi:hypothetical protein
MSQLIDRLVAAVQIFNDPLGIGGGNYDKLGPYYDEEITMGRVDDPTLKIGRERVLEYMNRTQLGKIPHFDAQIVRGSNPIEPANSDDLSAATLAGNGTYIDRTIPAASPILNIIYVFTYARKTIKDDWLLLSATAKIKR